MVQWPAMKESSPQVVVVAGPNGAGKSTAAPSLLQGPLRVEEFVNADVIAQGLSSFRPEVAALQAGRILLKRIEGLAARRLDFAFETTLASRSFAPWIRRLVSTGYSFSLVFLWVPTADIALARVRERFLAGGHTIPEDVVRRRYDAGLRNFFGLYQKLASRWHFYDNATHNGPRLIATGRRTTETHVSDARLWEKLLVQYGHGRAP